MLYTLTCPRDLSAIYKYVEMACSAVKFSKWHKFHSCLMKSNWKHFDCLIVPNHAVMHDVRCTMCNTSFNLKMTSLEWKRRPNRSLQSQTPPPETHHSCRSDVTAQQLTLVKMSSFIHQDSRQNLSHCHVIFTVAYGLRFPKKIDEVFHVSALRCRLEDGCH